MLVCKVVGGGAGRNIVGTVKSSLCRYLYIFLLKDDPFAWWLSNQKRYPWIARLAKKYLAMPPSSVDSERLWSSATWFYSDLRQRMKDDKLEQLMFLKANPEYLSEIISN